MRPLCCLFLRLRCGKLSAIASARQIRLLFYCLHIPLQQELEHQFPAHPQAMATQQQIDPVAASAAAREAEERAREDAAARRRHEAEVLKTAAEIRARRAFGRMNPHPEYRRGKTHWDHLLEEMTWLAKEFQRERRWKLQQARKAANAVARSNKDLESRVEVRAREEEKTLRRRASWIAREVTNFWGKAQRVVAFKVKTEVEAKKKEVMDRQLEALLGQTQKYSSLLAARLGADEKAEAVAAASKAAPQRAHIAVPSIKEEPVAGPSTSLQRETLQVPRPASVAPSAAHSANLDLGDGDDSQEYRSGEDDDADDEATLEEEERLAAAEGQDATEGGDAEAAALAEDADLPLEELLARYGYVVPAGVQEVSHVAEEEGGAGPSMTVAAVAFPKTRYEVDVASEDEGGGGGGEEGIGALLQNPLGYTPPPPSRLAAEFASLEAMEGGDDIDEAQMDDQAKASEPSTTRSRSSGKAVGTRRAIAAPAGGRAVTAGDEDEYRSGEDDDADDEATLEEEERLAAAEGQDATREGQVEAAGLAEDAELPLEELLARYGYVSVEHDNDTATAQAEHAEADRTQEPLPSSAAPGAATDGGVSAPEPLGGEEDESRPIDAETGTDADRIAGAMEALAAAQPTGYTLDTTKVKTPVPFLLKGQLREYQHIGLDWLVTLYHRRLNGILADEMGLGKTIQTIALLAWLACERGDWGPHLVVVPTSVMLNWEMEFKRWAPAFKLLTYYGNPKERAAKRQGWSKPNAFHVCITSYTLVLQDARMFKRKKWKYLILDEAHMIKNWRSQRWQTLLNFNSKRRLLITGTPLQNDLMELWSLMHFLMPQIFASHAQFKDWFSNPLTGMVEGSAEYNCAIVDRLHGVLRPFLLRRLKRDVEKQLPGKHEHVVKCRLSKRQRQLYEEYMSSGDTRATLASGNFLGIMNCLMQLRKVCNHPDLFEGRPIVSAWDMPRLELRVPSAVTKMLGNVDALQLRRDEETALTATSSTHVRTTLGLMPVTAGHRLAAWQMEEVRALAEPSSSFDCPATSPQEDLAMLLGGARGSLLAILRRTPSRQSLAAVTAAVQVLASQRRQWRSDRTAALGRISLDRTRVKSGVSWDFAIAARVQRPAFDAHEIAAARDRPFDVSEALLDMIKLPDRRAEELEDVLREFVFVIPRARAALPELWCSRPDASAVSAAASAARTLSTTLSGAATALLHVPSLRTQLFFPDRRLVQFDCGKLQEMAALLGRLKLGGHRALIFTQMSRMLDILESFLNIYGYTYVRLDGATKPETRQVLMQRFNTDSRIFCFILSTRSGGVGMNLTGADTVIFYDSDWNPAMDAQAQDRCHRIGQTREVHIYRLISEHTIEENILRKSDQKRQLDWLAIQSGGFTTDLLSKFDPKALLTGGAEGEEESAGAGVAADGERTGGVATTTRQDAETIRAAMRAAEDEGDAAAAAAVEREAAAEMDEFIKEPPPGAVNGLEDEQNGGVRKEDVANGDDEMKSPPVGPSRSGDGVEAGNEPSPPVAETGGIDEMEAIAGGAIGQSEDPLEALDSTLRPIERYAVRFVELEVPPTDADAVAAQFESAYKVEEFDVDAIEAAEEERVSFFGGGDQVESLCVCYCCITAVCCIQF
jgi:SNF2 family DNA or RNA helicase